MVQECDVCVIGAGPGGLAAAGTLAMHDRRVIVVNGGSLMGYGIEGAFKSKSEFEITRQFLQSRARSEVFGDTSPPEWQNVRAGIDRSADGLSHNLQDRMERLGVPVMEGLATIVDANTVRVADEVIQTQHIVIATGTTPRELPGMAADGRHVVTSDDIMALETLPESLVVLGGGIIGCEFAGMFGALGSQVTLVDSQDRILASEDPDTSAFLAEAMTRTGVKVAASSRIDSLRVENGKVHSQLSTGATVESDVVLLAVGRTPCTDKLGLEAAGIETDERGYIRTDDATMQTSLPNVYAVGDVGLRATPVDMALVHVAQAEGRRAAQHILGEPFEQSMDHVPYIIFTLPMIAGAGLSETDARQRLGDVRVGKYPFGRNHRAHAAGAPFGFVKLIVAPEGDDRIVGVRAVGTDSDSLVSAVSIMIDQEMPYTYLINSILPHPSLMESLQGAAHIVSGDALAFEEHEQMLGRARPD